MAIGLGGIFAAVSSIASAGLGMAQANYQAQVAKMNEQIAKDNATRALERGRVDAQDQGAQNRDMIGQAVAEMGASGAAITGKSFGRTRRSLHELANRDQKNVMQDAQIQSYNYKVEAANQASARKMAQLGGVGSLVEGFLGAGSSLVGGARGAPTKDYYYRPVSKPRYYPSVVV